MLKALFSFGSQLDRDDVEREGVLVEHSENIGKLEVVSR
jgi:hypothetical protein